MSDSQIDGAVCEHGERMIEDDRRFRVGHLLRGHAVRGEGCWGFDVGAPLFAAEDAPHAARLNAKVPIARARTRIMRTSSDRMFAVAADEPTRHDTSSALRDPLRAHRGHG